MPTLPLSRLSDYTATPLASTYEYPVDPTHELPVPFVRSSNSDRAPPNSASWFSGAELLQYYPLLRVPAPVYLVPPPNPYLPRRHSGKATSVSDRGPTGPTHESPVDNNAFLNICPTSESRNPRDFYPPQTSNYRATDATAAYSFPATVYSTPEQSVSLISRPCHCSGIGRSGDFSSVCSNSVLNSHPALHSAGSTSRGPLHLLSLCPTPISTPITDLGSCVYFPCSAANLYPAHDSTLASATYSTRPSAASFQMDYMNSRKLGAPDRTLLQDDPDALGSDPNGYTSLSPRGCTIPDEHHPSADGFPSDNQFGSSNRGQDQSPFRVSQSSTFLDASVSDIPLSNLEELLARTSIGDVYLGPVKGSDGKLLPLDPSVRTVNECLSIPYSASSLAFSPPGIIMVTEMWPMFVTDRLSHCNHRIHGMNLETLRNCLYDHNLNQLGSPAILRRRLQEFVRRVRDASTGCLRSDSSHYQEDTSEDSDQHIATESGNSVEATASPSESISRTVKLPKPVILAPDTFYSYLLIIDLEATCDSQEHRQHNTSEYPHEIIEFPVLLYNTRTRRCVGVFHSYCKPKLRPDLSSFCTNLTQISQVQVDNAYPFPHVLAQIEKWLFEQHGLSDVRCAIVCDCSADMSKFMRIQCRLDQIPLPSWATVWINLSKAFRIFYKLPVRHRVTLSTMLQDLNLSFIGQQHRGLDDAINILRVVRTLLADGCLLRVNERVDFGRPPNYVTSVPRLVAEATSGLMGSRLVLLTRKSKCNSGYSSSSDKEDKHAILPSDLPEDHRQSLLWLASVQRTRVPRDQ